MCTAMLWDPEEKAREIEQKMKEAEELKNKNAEEHLNKVARKQTLLERIEQKLRSSLKMVVSICALFVKLLQN
jgi:hypothetical protein